MLIISWSKFEIYIREQEQTPIFESLRTSNLIQVMSPLVIVHFFSLHYLEKLIETIRTREPVLLL